MINQVDRLKYLLHANSSITKHYIIHKYIEHIREACGKRNHNKQHGTGQIYIGTSASLSLNVKDIHTIGQGHQHVIVVIVEDLSPVYPFVCEIEERVKDGYR